MAYVNTIGYDLTHEINEFSQPKILSDIETVKNVLMFILFAERGQYPSLPHIGMNLKYILYEFYDDIDTDALREDIIVQCRALDVYFSSGDIQIQKLKYNNAPSILIYVGGAGNYPRSYKVDNTSTTNQFMIGVTYDQFKNILVSINE